MVQDLLEYAGGQIGKKFPVKPEAADMGDLCRNAIEEVQLAYPEVSFNFESAGDLKGFFDPTRLNQVLSNLLINAAKYSEQGKPVTLSAQSDLEAITLEVKNFGNPIPPESLQVIFDPLVQLSSRGTGSTLASLDSPFIARQLLRVIMYDRS